MSPPIQFALITGSLNSISTNIPAQWIVALVEKKKWSLRRGIEYAQQKQFATELAAVLSGLARSAEEPQKTDLLRESLRATAAAVSSEELYWGVLVAQIAETPGNLREEALELAQGNLLPWALTKVFKQRPDMCDRAAVEHALERARAEESDWLRAEMLGDLVPLLDAPLRAKEREGGGDVLSEGISAASPWKVKDTEPRPWRPFATTSQNHTRAELLEQGLLSAIRSVSIARQSVKRS